MAGDEGTVALVTGASHGIGLETARQLAQQGMRVVVTARDEDKARGAVEVLAGEGDDGAILPMALDVASSASASELARRMEDEVGRLDVLVNNAAGYVDWSETASGADLETSRALFDVNLFGTWQVIQALLPLLRRSPHGRVVNVASGAGSHGDTDFGLTTKGGTTASYAISKAAVNALTAKLAAELEGSGLLVNSVDPGLTATAPGMEDMGARPVPEGARSVVWAALLPDDGPSGGFFRDGRPHPW